MKRVFIFKFYIFVLCLPGSILSMDECASRMAKIMMMADGVSSQDGDKAIKFSQECLEKSCNIAAAS